MAHPRDSPHRTSSGLILLVFMCIFARHVASLSEDLTTWSPTLVTRGGGMVFPSAVRNLTVTTNMFHKGSRLLQLHISWKLPTEGRRPNKLILHVVPTIYTGCPQEPGYCPDGFIYQVIENMEITNVTVPKHPRTQPFKIISECCYEIKIESSPHNGKTFAAKNFTVPECTGEVCSCRGVKLPIPNVTSVSAFDNTAIRVTWSVEANEEDCNITKFIVRLGEEAIRSNADLPVFNTSIWQEVLSDGHHKYVAVLNASLKYDRNYKVGVLAKDQRNCHGSPGQLIFKPRDLREITQQRNKNMMALPVALGVLLFVAGLCLVAVLTRSRWVNCVKKRLGLGRLRPTDVYKPVRIHSDVTRFSDVVMSALRERNILYVEAEIEEARQRGQADMCEISHDRLKYMKEIGKGAFGRVFMAQSESLAGVAGPIIVAVKKLGPQASDDETEEFLAEIAMMKCVGRHPNVVAMLGCCTLARPYCMVMEFIPCGDLLRYLHALRTEYHRRTDVEPKYLDLMLSSSDSRAAYIFPGEKSDSSVSVFSSPSKTNSRSSVPKSQWSLLSSTGDIPADIPVHGRSHVEYILDSKELQNFALQVARGMAYLEQKQITHRDLAARNVLIDEHKTLKISDFGLSRSGIYVNMKHKKVPLRWLSIEAIQDNLYSSKSDVWAFAVLLWEIGTLGAFPYPTVGDYRLLPYLLEGKRLEKPDNCTKELYGLMMQCWSQSVDDRPSFADLVSSLESMSSRRHVYVDFTALEKGYTFPPTEEDLKHR